MYVVMKRARFKDFLANIYCWRLIRNTFLLNLYDVIFGFPAPIILALLFNELRNRTFKRVVQTISYMPHFISLVVVCGLIVQLSSSQGLINDIIAFFGGQRSALLQRPELFRPIFVASEIWQHVGWNTIIYLAALSGIDQELYEASTLDGANKFQRIRYITIPGIMPVIIILFILRLGNMLNVSFEKVMLLYNPTTYKTADVINTFVYRKGLQDFAWSFSAAVGLFNSLINFPLNFNINAYRAAFVNPNVLQGYKNTIFILVVGVALNILMTSLGAYFLSRKNILLKNAIMFFIVFTMFFQGGLIPAYLNIRDLGLYDTRWALILPMAINTFYLVIMRTGFMQVPDSMEESAIIDGANDLQILFRIIILLSMPVVAVMILYYGVFHWNSWFQAVIFLRDRKLFPMQLILREVLVQNTELLVMGQGAARAGGNIREQRYNIAESIKYATVVITTVPILFVYPFLQRYFVKGIMIGALKG
jgi:ABC-type polysaccharide transport system permease subunit